MESTQIVETVVSGGVTEPVKALATTGKGASKIGAFFSKATGRAGLVLSKHSPEILLFVGVAGIITSTVLACRSTLKVDEVLDRHEEKMDRINEVFKRDEPEKYSEQDMKKDKTVVYVQTAVDYIKLYGPAASLMTISICCILGSYRIMHKRQIALLAAFNSVTEAYNAYRQRVIEDFGEQKDYMYRHGLREEEVTEIQTDEDGKTKKVKKQKLVDDGLADLSQYARRYNQQTSSQWMLNPEGSSDHTYNLMYLRTQQNSFNDLLQSRGHVFLNEVYDCLGLDRSPEGQLVGWVKGNGDDYVDFGLDYTDQFMKQNADEFILDFNVDGAVHEMI